MAADKPFKMGDFRMGKIGTKFLIYRKEWFKYLTSENFEKAIDDAYKEACKHCKEIKLPAPPKPKIQL